MIILQHTSKQPEAAEWQEKLKTLTVAHKVVVKEDIAPVIHEGEKRFEGVEAINTFLNDYEAFMKSWNQDRCDMWFLD